jgi:alkylhydroperoxidase family enzyme
MARLRLLDVAELEERGVDVSPFLSEFAELPGSVATLGYRPDILSAVMGLWNAIMAQGTLPAPLKFMAGYMASMAAGCRYCSAHTATKAHESGADEKLAAIWMYESSPLFSDAERAALRFAQLAGMAPSGVEDRDVANLQLYFSEPEIVELLSVISLYGFFNRWNDSLATPLEATPRGFAETHLKSHGWEIGQHD